MSLEQKVMTDLKIAMLAKDEKALRSLRAIKAAILLAKNDRIWPLRKKRKSPL